MEAEEYHPFNGIVLTDTFQSYEEGDSMDEVLFPHNNERIERQKDLDIRVILGNPPWSATDNRAYATIDGQVQRRYAASSAAKKTALYDPYVRAIRLASDRIRGSQNGGIVAFVTNGGFIDSNSFDGFRKTVAEEFHTVYCYNLRGDQRTSGEKSRQEGGKVFGQESRAGVAILLLVKKPGESPGATIYYRDIGDYRTREEKLKILEESRLSNTEWETIIPNQSYDWIGQRSETYNSLRPLTAENGGANMEGLAPIFNVQTLGLVTSRDAWCYASSLHKLKDNIQRSVEFYNGQVEEFRKTNPTGSLSERALKARDFVGNTPRQFHWGRENYRNLANGETYHVQEAEFRISSYRPFFKQHLYFSRKLNNSIREFPRLYPYQQATNLGISITGLASNNPFHALMTDNIPEYCLTAVNSIYLPRWRYAPAQPLTHSIELETSEPETSNLERVSNINQAALAQFREHYGDNEITEDDLFYYTYGVVHSQQWRETFEDDLAKTGTRVPMPYTGQDFQAFSAAGRELAELHANYESVDPYPLLETTGPEWEPDSPDAYRVTKMAYLGPARNPDKSGIVCNANITLSGIPDQAHHYRLGSRSALDWLIERYQIRTDTKNGITNDPNDWATEHGDPRYIIDLIKRITTVSVRTVEIVQGLPQLPI